MNNSGYNLRSTTHQEGMQYGGPASTTASPTAENGDMTRLAAEIESMRKMIEILQRDNENYRRYTATLEFELEEARRGGETETCEGFPRQNEASDDVTLQQTMPQETHNNHQ